METGTICKEPEQRPVGERQKDLTVLKVRIWRTGKDHLKFFTNRKIFGQIVVSGLRNVMKLMESIIWLPHLAVKNIRAFRFYSQIHRMEHFRL